MADAYRLGDLASRVGASVAGDPERRIRGVATLEEAGPSDLAFLTNPKYRKAAESTRAGAILVPKGTRLPGHDLLEAPEPYLALAEILDLLYPARARRPGVSPLAFVGEGARTGEGSEVGPFAVLGEGAFAVAIQRRREAGKGRLGR